MRSITTVELGVDICALARTSVRRGEIRLTAAELLDPAAFPGLEALTLAVRQTRRSLGLPRRCRIVVWGLPDGASPRDPAVQPLIQPLTGAGFRVDRVVSPCNALAALARRMKTSRGEGSTCWIAINRGGVAIVVVRPGKLLYSHSFAWDSSVGSSGSQARLLQRYSLVSFLSPEIKRAIAESRKFGTPVDAVVTCGNLPELRSLTMPLIEELDVEVETLDSLEGLVVTPQVAEKLAEWAPAIRLACAATIARGTRPWDPSKKPAPWNTAGTFVRAAGLAAALAGIGYLLYMNPGTLKRAPAPPAVSTQSTNLPPKGGSYTVGRGASAPAASEPAPAVSDSAKKAESNPQQPESKGPVSVPAPAAKSTPPAVNLPAAAAGPTSQAASVSAPAAKPAPPGVSDSAKRAESNPKQPESNPAAPKTASAPIPWKPAVVTPSPAVSAAKKPEPKAPAVNAPSTPLPPRGGSYTVGRGANAPALSEPAKKPESKGVNAANTVPRARMQPLLTLPLPNMSAPKAPVPPSTPASVRAPGVIATAPAPRPAPPAVSAPATAPPAVSESAKKPESKGALIPPAPAADKAATGSTSASSQVRSPQAGVSAGTAFPAAPVAPTATAVRPASAVPRGPMPALLKDVVPRVTAILVASDRRFATVDGGQIIGIGDLLGRRTVVGMDERSVLLQEPSGVQIRIGLGGRLLGVERGR